MKFIHTADLHLDSPFRGLADMSTQIWQRVHRSTFTAFERIVDNAIKEQVDFVLIVGDIYDRDHHSAEAEDFFVRQCQRLNEHQIPVYLSYGNHDYQIVSERENSLPKNVRVFGNQVETKTLTLSNKETVSITGFSYGKRWLSVDQVSSFPSKTSADWHIGMLHGALAQNNPEQDHYAPFTVAELLQKNYDYWALGHIHKRQVLNEDPSVVYPGIPQGRHKNEDGQHGYYLVQSDSGKLKNEFKAIAPIEWCTVNVNLGHLQATDTIIERLQHQVKSGEQFKMIALNIQLTDEMNALTKQLITNGTILERLQEQIAEEGSPKWWPYQINLLGEVNLPKMTDLDQEYWDQAAKEVFIQSAMVELAGKLSKYDFIADRLTEPSMIEKLRREANQELGKEEHHED
ncbi:metallophosphoesterase family protein [Limosilactobacillus fastidiosus]|uniref:DNA repair exonuclease n=1 Tax=Limosilactobacillus fastidiosus TaxID=2759855 RepID=A0A7W3YD18_9LACO|nr:DNA repair exonuclease [Limosilactobacillus fastidiosus]MBB1063666.1 DNA repair exonuclease [Limosilactobacillus fastidiosus]MBB1086805.1 DNA repair exonuclease [Limosilactobacillus fastidiosus]MCD7084241.1 DNA repair exonuclease [Limosilactobacillus fastidiosus]MCD7085468.1 DNA repair exonuclease [Limosilactobacillus fastidiosus]MCD7114699.1 DNA repair exonuclease [Limosilactobacillus fastidiosus]